MRIDIKYKHLNILKSTIAIIAIALCSNYISAQTKTEGGVTRIDGNVEFDKTIHDFGDVMINDGPLSCTFNIKNISKQPMAIYNVVSSCGCTNVHWTREPIQAGGKGKISATYSNDEGPYPKTGYLKAKRLFSQQKTTIVPTIPHTFRKSGSERH